MPLIPRQSKVFEIPKSLKEAEQRLPQLSPIEGSELRFSKIPKDNELPFKATTTADITQHSIDRSSTFYAIMNKERPFELLGEVQFSFICFLIGQNYDGFEQWKSLIKLFCNCDEAIGVYPEFFISFLNILYFEFNEIPKDFFYDTLSRDNFLTIVLHNLFDNINGIQLDNDQQTIKLKLKSKANQFKLYLQEKFNFDFDTEPDEYAPVVVAVDDL
jgi:A1 cistron-splicing factor AAR2